MESTIKSITQIINREIEENPLFEDCFIVDIVNNNTKVEIFLDCDSGMTFSKCQKMSRIVEGFLDESLMLGEKYTLDVSSPGIDRPLKMERQYNNNIGRSLKIKTEDNKYKGKLLSVENGAIVIQVSKGKKNKEEIQLNMKDITEAKVLVSFSKN